MSGRTLIASAALVAALGIVVFTWSAQGRRGQAQERQQRRGRRAQRQTAPTPRSVAEGATLLSQGDSYDDFTSVARTKDGTLHAAYAAYYDGHDQIRLHRRLPSGDWSTHSHVPVARARADLGMPQLAVDAADRVWVVWSEQTGQTATRSGDWNLFARARKGESWGPLVQLTDDAKPDINHHVTTDAGGTIYVVWQAHPQNNGDIQLARFDGETWSKPLAVTSGPGSDWYPQAAVDAEGVVWIAFDSYRNDDYDVFLTSVRGDHVGPVIPVATSKYYEAHASVACTRDGRVWVAWEQGGFNWGKDQGYWLRLKTRNVGSTLGSERQVRVVAYHNSQLWAAPDVAESLPPAGERDRRQLALGGLAAGADGRLWVRFRRQRLSVTQTRQGQRRRRVRRYWTENVSYLTADGWQAAQELPESSGRISVFSRLLSDPDGSLHVAYSGDRRAPPNTHQPIHDQALVATVPTPEAPASFPELERYSPPEPPAAAATWDAGREREQVDAIRTHRVTIDGKPHRIVRGDLHRHTELSWDVGPGNDGSYLDFYRYMIDVAAMDFGGLSDHQGGGHYAYHWWLTEKSADMYYLPPRFVALYGYERSVSFPNGHRNVFHSYRGVPVFPFQLRLDQTGVFPGVGTRAVVDNDTKLLFEYLRRTGGVAISHTSGTNMGTDWRDNDPVVEPVVEIYQGARNSYEALGAPRVHDVKELPPAKAPGGYHPEGMVWNAWNKGYRLGTITSSDHGSTHISYALVYTPENSREAIIDSIRKRQTYGATDNIIVDLRVGDHFMGEELTAGEKPEFVLRARGTAAIARVDVIRNGEYVYSAEPGKKEIEIKYLDMKPPPGTSYYYFRLRQEDGELAWTSPVWVTYKSE
ncbi:MAG: hypothetical protein O7J95_19130 [Planctomycetota bacterium]|nr:hypothetical protein [Planctomycetota bacterium]